MDGLKELLMILLVVGYSCRSRNTGRLTREELMKKGASLYTTHGCNVCRSLDGSIVYGPPLNKIHMKDLTVLRKGREHKVKAGRKFLMRAINDPNSKKEISYRNKQVPHTSLPKEEAELLVDYLILPETGKTYNK
ncbi:MAG: hypothetical protein ACOC0R_06790 [Mariniphaga sp.]